MYCHLGQKERGKALFHQTFLQGKLITFSWGPAGAFVYQLSHEWKEKEKKIQIFQNTRNGKYYFSDTEPVM